MIKVDQRESDFWIFELWIFELLKFLDFFDFLKIFEFLKVFDIWKNCWKFLNFSKLLKIWNVKIRKVWPKAKCLQKKKKKKNIPTHPLTMPQAAGKNLKDRLNFWRLKRGHLWANCGTCSWCTRAKSFGIGVVLTKNSIS